MARPILDLSNQTFGFWTIVEGPIRKGKITFWKCKCRCGTIRFVMSHKLTSGTSISCDCVRRKNISGQRFGLLVADKFVEMRKAGTKNNVAAYWLCKCDCGNTKIINQWRLQSGQTRSCGCLNTIGRCQEKGKTGFNLVYGAYKRGAIKRNITFSLSKEEFLEIVIKPCLYCGNGPSHAALTPYRQSKYGSIETINQSQFFYTGIDRVDNDKGYTLDNSVPCCFDCNIAKHQMSQEKFITFITKIYKNFVEKR